ncbi:MAG: SAF domain-containing protein, partial [Bifidobacterium sp.]|nr:SAF domain-containing protein [Bifidobacterium sp.]
MVDFSIFSNIDKPSAAAGSLTRRRRLFKLRRAGAALALGLAVFCTLQILVQAQGRLSVLVASRPIARGSAIEPGMVETRILHGRERLPGLIASFGQVRGRRLMISLHTGQPLTTAMISSRPAQPPGTTPVTVRLADDPADLQAGDKVNLLASGDCPAGAGPHPVQPSSLPPTSARDQPGADRKPEF